jgi:hypothetical protein
MLQSNHARIRCFSPALNPPGGIDPLEMRPVIAACEPDTAAYVLNSVE